MESLLFDETDIKEAQGLVGECVVDNWDVVAIVYDPKQYPEADYSREVQRQYEAVAERYGVKFMLKDEVFKK